MTKVIAFNKEARHKLLEGCRLMAQAVGSTYSPVGRNVAYARQWGSPKIVHDGVTVAKEVESEDELVQMGIDLIKEAAQNQVSVTGDGTSLTTILAYNIVDQGVKLIDDGANPMVIRKQILKALPELIKALTLQAKPVKTREQIKHVALVSSDDEEIAEAVTEAIDKVGMGGLVTVEYNKRQKIETEYTDGMKLDRGWGSYPHFVTNPDRMEAVVEDASVLVLGRKISLIDEVVPLLEVVIAQGSKNIVIFGEVSGDAMSTIIMQRLRGNINALVVAPPNYAEARRDALEDIAILTGATVVTDEIGMSKEQFRQAFNKDWIGSTKKVIASKGTTNIIKYESSHFKNDAAKKNIEARNQRINDRIESIRQELKNTDVVYDKEKLQERLSRLTTGIAVVKVGSSSELETNEKMERVKDAVPAAQAASEEGIVPGGSIALLHAVEVVLSGSNLTDGEKILRLALSEPIVKILTNAGEDLKSAQTIIEEIKKKGGNYGYNVLTEKVEDLMKAGVIDPVKVIRLALENAVNVATSILTTDTVIAIKKEKVETNMNMV